MSFIFQAAAMANKSVKLFNKKLRRRLVGLRKKIYEYGELEGIELAFIVRNKGKGTLYWYTSNEQVLSWLNSDYIVS